MGEGAARTRRLFAGIELGDAARAACADVASALTKTGFAAKYESPDKLHVTLAFLGNVAPERTPETISALEAAAAVPPFALAFDKLGAFPHERRPRVVYIGSREQGPAFRSLSSALRGTYAALGFAFDDDAVAHVTIARTKDPQRPLPLVEFTPINIVVERVTLFESLFDKARNTSRYEIIATAPLLS